jgi:hypothetical protein
MPGRRHLQHSQRSPAIVRTSTMSTMRLWVRVGRGGQWLHPTGLRKRHVTGSQAINRGGMKPSLDAGVARASSALASPEENVRGAVLIPMWHGWAHARCRSGRGEHSHTLHGVWCDAASRLAQYSHSQLLQAAWPCLGVRCWRTVARESTAHCHGTTDPRRAVGRDALRALTVRAECDKAFLRSLG